MSTLLIVYPGIVITFVAVFALAIRWQFSLDRKRTETLLALVLLAEPAGMACEFIAHKISALEPLKFDPFVFYADKLIGLPGFHLAQIVYAHEWLKILVSVSYGLGPMAALGTLAMYLWFAEAEFPRVLRAILLNLFLAPLIYLAFPVCGPAFAVASFPRIPASVPLHAMLINAAPNGVPSVHTSSALLVMWFLWRWKWGRVAGVNFLLLTILATLGSGQHYVFDLLCAVPYAGTWVWITGEIQTCGIISTCSPSANPLPSSW